MKPTPPAGKFMERKPPRKEATEEEASGLRVSRAGGRKLVWLTSSW